jgi:RimJ/RimL family protein N-acetyltransferase
MLNGKLVCLVPYKKEYIPMFLKWANDLEIANYLTIYFPTTLEQIEEEYNKAIRDPNRISFSIITCSPDQHEGKLIGNVGAEINWKERIATIGIIIGEKDFLGKGYGTDATITLLEYLFKNLNMMRVELSTFDFNIRAQKCYHKVGFVDEGIKRKAKYMNGNYHDVIFMGILRNDWDAAQKKKV